MIALPQYFNRRVRFLYSMGKAIGFIIPVFFLASAFMPSGSFEEIQKSYERVSDAYLRKEEYFLMKCRAKEIPEETFGNMFIRVFKQEQVMEVWVQKPNGQYIKFNEFKVYAMSGTLGPKRQQGDAQVPEGFYYINDYNPVSNYHLSLGVSYPNESDLRLSNALKKGGDIYIHGGQASSGCMAMSNYYIEDIYIAAVKAHSRGQQKIPVHIYPFKPTVINVEYYTRFPQYSKHVKLWRNMAQGYMMFERTNRIPDVYVGNDGYYRFTDPASVQAAK
ncbi:MAG: L,D-transpeptidase family protein [Chitinophagales bacterium]